jgi:aryl-alcohol dehydrogenase-like predicted oxidoreductase
VRPILLAVPADASDTLGHFHGDAVVAIPGATSVHQAQASAHAMSFKLTGEELARLDELLQAVRA